jgi:hypothetical protein
MLKVETISRKRKAEDTSFGSRDETILVVNGEELNRSCASHYNGGLSAHIHYQNQFHLFYEEKMSSLQAIFTDLSFYNGLEWCPEDNDWHAEHHIIQYFVLSGDNIQQPQDYPYIKYELGLIIENWANPWPLTEFVYKLQQTVEYLNVPGVTFFVNDPTINGCGVKCQIRDIEASAADEVHYWNPIVARILDATLDAVQANIHPDKVVSLFQFPQSIATACEQYLLYFVQFLSDLGIEADAELSHNAKSVLFSVTPKNGPGALEQIRDALDIYLRIPGSPTFSAEASDLTDTAVRQLEANVYHLKSQLALASALIKAKDATIEVLELSNFQYRQLVSNSRSIEIAESKSPEDSEMILHGMVSITPYEGWGFKINLPQILRLLKRKLKSDD